MLSENGHRLLEILYAHEEGVQLIELAKMLPVRNARAVSQIRSGIKTNLGGHDVIESLYGRGRTVIGYRLKSDERPTVLKILHPNRD